MIKLKEVPFNEIIEKYCDIVAYNSKEFKSLEEAEAAGKIVTLLESEQIREAIMWDMFQTVGSMEKALDGKVEVFIVLHDDKETYYEMHTLYSTLSN